MDRMQTAVGDKPGAVITHGWTSLTLTEGGEGDVLALSSHNGITCKEGSASLGMDFLGKIVAQGGPRLRMEHSWASKLSAKALAAFLSAVTIRASTPGKRTVELLVSDGVADPNCCTFVFDAA